MASRFSATDPAEYEHFMGRWSRRLAKPFLEFAGIRPRDRVLDVGCGTGVLTTALAEIGAEAVGIDASEPYLEGARRHRSHQNITYELGDVRRMRFGDASFDGAISTLVLDIIPEVDQVVAEMRRVTRPGGVVASGLYDFWGGFSAFRGGVTGARGDADGRSGPTDECGFNGTSRHGGVLSRCPFRSVPPPV